MLTSIPKTRCHVMSANPATRNRTLPIADSPYPRGIDLCGGYPARRLRRNVAPKSTSDAIMAV
jgi:hypothetical protein